MRLMVFILIFCAACYQSKAQSKQELNIRQLLNHQTQMWNNGDIEGFMQTYWKSDSLLFIGKTGVTKGWHNTLNNYLKGYPNKASMGQLQFEIIKVEPLSKTTYNVIGRWHLTRTIGNIEGYYTLLIKKIKGKWLIVQDHSS